MGKKLVIVESPAKAKTINKILGKDYIVKASMGHVRDLPVRNLGVDIEKNFEPKYVMVTGRKAIITELKKAAKECDSVYLAPDPDREGEAIAWHLQELLKTKKRELPCYRVTYNEITPRAVKEAFDNPTEIDHHRVDAQQARRILDRIVGYKVSPLLWSRLQRGLSAGRVQSVALRLICEREKLILDFVPEDYWIMGARARKVIVPMDPFDLKLARIDDQKADIKSAELAAEISSELSESTLKVKQVNTRTVTRRSKPPYITSTLQQAGSSFYGFSPARTMRIAQSLYEGVNLGEGPTGLITYMRTDSVSLSKDAVDECRAYIDKTFGGEYIPGKPNAYKSRSGAQAAHEAVRPTDVSRTPDAMKGILEKDDLKLYTLIWQRFVACQMTPAKIEQRTAEVDAVAGDGASPKHTYLFRATASEVIFPGYMKASGVEAPKAVEKPTPDKAGAAPAETDDIDSLPPLTEGEPLECLEWLSEAKQTQPPSRFSEASLVRALEENGVGRPSTYAQILSTLNTRKYVTKEKRTLTPTELGMSVNGFLSSELEGLFNVTFTASMEEALDKIESGELEWTTMLAEFYEQFAGWLEKAKGPPVDIEKIQALLTVLEPVTEWKPPQKQGRRTYDDHKFVDSIQEQLTEGKKPFTDRQLLALARVACQYRTQLTDLKTAMAGVGLADLLIEVESDKPLDSTTKKLEVMEGLKFAEPVERNGRKYDDEAFVGSLRGRVEGGRSLTENQRKALDRLVMKYGSQIEGFEALRAELELPDPANSEDKESGPLLAALKNVAEWNAPVKRGKREFNDESFFQSLSEQLEQKAALSERQRSALKRLVRRYREQIPGYEALAEEFEIKEPAKKKKAGADAGDED